MSALAVMFIAMGTADACRRLTRVSRVPVAIGVLAVIACAALSGLWRLGDVGLLAIAAAATVGWELLCTRAERTGNHQGAPLVVFGAATALLIVFSAWGSKVGGIVERWSAWTQLPLDGVTPTRLLMIIGVVLLQIVTGNQLVRLVLASVGAVRPAGEPQPSDRLKGGRLLGPMERLLIFGLGLGGQVAAATAVVAAKSIIRFPELNAQKGRENGTTGENGNVGIDDVTEYFLVGSFASWLLSFAGLALVIGQ